VHDVTGKAFEDFRTGECIALPEYTITAEEIIAFAQRYDPQYFHTDPEAAQASPFGGLIASGWMTAAVFMRMQCDAFILASTSMGAPGVDDIHWLRPVRPGDVLSGDVRIREVRPSRSKPDRGAVFADATVRNQHGEEVMTLRTRAIFQRRTAAGV
jgi:acyl dehydratase